MNGTLPPPSLDPTCGAPQACEDDWGEDGDRDAIDDDSPPPPFHRKVRGFLVEPTKEAMGSPDSGTPRRARASRDGSPSHPRSTACPWPHRIREVPFINPVLDYTWPRGGPPAMARACRPISRHRSNRRSEMLVPRVDDLNELGGCGWRSATLRSVGTSAGTSRPPGSTRTRTATTPGRAPLQLPTADRTAAGDPRAVARGAVRRPRLPRAGSTLAAVPRGGRAPAAGDGHARAAPAQAEHGAEPEGGESRCARSVALRGPGAARAAGTTTSRSPRRTGSPGPRNTTDRAHRDSPALRVQHRARLGLGDERVAVAGQQEALVHRAVRSRSLPHVAVVVAVPLLERQPGIPGGHPVGLRPCEGTIPPV